MEYTKGPWEVFGKANENIFSEATSLSIVDSNGFEIARSEIEAFSMEWLEQNPDKHWGMHKEHSIRRRDINELLSNIKLMTASPELLEACEAALNAINYVTHAGNHIDDVYKAERLLKKAISKAEGRDGI